MKAVVQARYGAFENVLSVKEVAVPVLKDDEVLVNVRAASVHADVWHVVTGRPHVMRLFGSGLLGPKKKIPGTDLSGIVEALGPKVTHFQLGDEVFGESHRGIQWVNGGAFAEYAAVPESALALKPPHVTFEQAAAVPSSGYIALINLHSVKLAPGSHLLINGAGGGVGSIALQYAKALGAHVTAVDSAEKLEMLRTLGADKTINFQTDDFTTMSDRYDIILDVVSTLTLNHCKRVLSPGGKYIRIGHEHYGQRGSRTFGSMPSFFGLMLRAPFTKELPRLDFSLLPKQVAMNTLSQLLQSGELTPVIDRVFTLEETPQALRYLEQGRALGKILIAPNAAGLTQTSASMTS